MRVVRFVVQGSGFGIQDIVHTFLVSGAPLGALSSRAYCLGKEDNPVHPSGAVACNVGKTPSPFNPQILMPKPVQQ